MCRRCRHEPTGHRRIMEDIMAVNRDGIPADPGRFRGLGVLDLMLAEEHERLTGTRFEPQPPPKGDPALCRSAFEDACRTSVSETISWTCPIDVNRDLIEVFGSNEVVDHIALSEAHGDLIRTRRCLVERYGRPHPDPDTYRAAGRLAGRGLHLRIVAQESGGDDLPRFRLLDREISFTRVARKTIRIRNLQPAEQAARDRRDRATVRLRETLDRKARDAATPTIGRLLDAFVRLDRGYLIPRSWHDDGYLPEQLVGRSLAASVEFVAAHHQTMGFDRVTLVAWQANLNAHIRKLAVSRANSPVPPPATFSIGYPEDEEFLAGLT